MRKGLTKGLNKTSSKEVILYVVKDKAFMDENQTYQYSTFTLTAVAIILESSSRAGRSTLFCKKDFSHSKIRFHRKTAVPLSIPMNSITQS